MGTNANRELGRRSNDLNNEIVTALGRFDEALDMLAAWAAEYPDTHLARASRSLLNRCGAGPGQVTLTRPGRLHRDPDGTVSLDLNDSETIRATVIDPAKDHQPTRLDMGPAPERAGKCEPWI